MMPNANRFEGQVFVVTGASTGFGRGIAVALAREGARVVNADLTEAPTPGNYDERPELSTVALVESEGGEAVFSRCDVSKAADIGAAVALAVERYGRLDGFVNNAGIYRGGAFHELTEDDLDACFDVIVRGTWLGSQAAIRQFLRQGGGGAIVNIVSTAGLRGHANQAAYNAAKGAQANLTRALAVEYARQDIRVNAVCPTYMKSAMSRISVEDPAFDAVIAATIPKGKWGEIGDVAGAALYLLSRDAEYLAGVLLPVDGGENAGASPV
jgi:NAD(P)-dependent dehydrogenase (short-subunit alcohol dehydrogenase family)